MNISIIAVGKLKENYLKEGIAEYSKRLSRYCKLQIFEVPDEKAPENISKKEMETVKNKEGDCIDKYLREGSFKEGIFREGSYKIALTIDGKMFSSEELSTEIGSIGLNGTSHIIFIIGGSLGLSDNIIKKCDLELSFSKMTFPHQLMRLILLEQIYRSFKIISGETYHK